MEQRAKENGYLLYKNTCQHCLGSKCQPDISGSEDICEDHQLEEFTRKKEEGEREGIIDQT